MSNSNSKVVSHGTIYLAGNILRRIVSFVMLPIYTHYLTAEHYGTIELLSMVIDVVAILFGLKIGEAIYRFYFEYEGERDRNQVIFTSLALVALLNAAGVIFLVLAARPLALAIFGTVEAARLLALFSFTLIFQSLTETIFTFIRAQQRPWMFVGFSTMKLIVQLALNIYFVVVMKLAVEGVVVSALVSGVVVAIPLVAYTLSRTGISFSLDKARHMVGFSYPLVLTSLISFYMTFGDRYFLRLLGGGLDEVGVYALGYRFGFLISFIVAEPFFSIWNSEKYLAAKQPDAPQRMRMAFLMLTGAMVWVMVGISVFVHDVLRVMSAPEFWGAYVIVPIVMLGYVFNSWASFTNLGLLINRRTGVIAAGTAISAVLITAGYLVLIPWWGGVGAALATTIAFGARTIWITVRGQQLYRLPLAWGRAAAMIGGGALAWGLTFLAPEPLYASMAVDFVVFIGFTIALVALPGMLPPDVRRQLRLALGDRWNQVRRRRSTGTATATAARGAAA